MLKRIVLCAALVAIAGSVATAAGPSLSVIPTLAGDTSNQARAITPDGAYVVGVSGTRGFLYPVGAANAINVLSDNGAQAEIATGVGYRTVGGSTQLIVGGTSSGGWVTEWMTADGGATFPGRRRTASNPYLNPGSYNTLGAALGSDVYYVTARQNNNAGVSNYLLQMAGPWIATKTDSSKGITSPDRAVMNGASASGRAVGWRGTSSSAARGYMLTWNGTATPDAAFLIGLNGTDAGEAFSVSADGMTIFGRSPIEIGGTSLYPYKIVNPGVSQTINQLPIGAAAGSTSLAAPYGASADGRYAVGMLYLGTERAALWDTGDPNPANWTVLNLTQFAQDYGLLTGWTALTRAYSVGVNALGQPVVTGIGSYGGTTRAFVLTIPEPATLAFLAIGALPLLRRRR